MRRKSRKSDQWSGLVGRQLGKPSLVNQFAIAATIILGLTMVILGSWVSRRISDGVLQSSAAAGALYMASFLEPQIQGLAPGQTLPAAAIAELDRIAASFALRQHVLSIKIWQPDGTIVYASQKAMIGRRFPIDEVEPALQGKVQGYLAELDEDENAFERTLSVPVYEIYAPLYASGTRKIIAVGEFYENATRLEAELHESVLDTWLVVGGSAACMLAFLLAIVRRGSDTIDRQRETLRLGLEEQVALHRANADMQTRMHRAMQESALIDDRIQRRLGAELHDGPAQLLSFVLLRLDEIEESQLVSPRSNAGGNDVIAEVRVATIDALNELRGISTGLFLPYLEKTDDLVDTLRYIITLHEQRTGTLVRFEADNVPTQLPSEIIRCAARLTQESLTNAYKHGGGIDQRVFLVGLEGELELSISDGGPGLAQAARDGSNGERLGLAGMRYRAESAGGSMVIESSHKHGVHLLFRIPVGG